MSATGARALGADDPRTAESASLAASKKGVGDAAQDLGGAPKPKWSSGVAFYPPSDRLWRIGGKWYNFEPYLKHHPGGPEVVRLARDRFEDATYAFESHHHNYARARKIIAKYEVPAPAEVVVAPERPQVVGIERLPRLLDDDAFYSVLRRRLTEHLVQVGCPAGGPTRDCVVGFWLIFAAFVASWLLLFATGRAAAAVLFALLASLLGAFGHNWVHQPRYRFWAVLSLDTIGFSSAGWYREHVLQHHMFTNTPWDNHFKGTEPFLVTDPSVPRNWFQKYVCSNLSFIVLTFGLPANYLFHLGEMLKGHEEWRIGKLILPLNVAALICKWGLVRGVLLSYAWVAVLGNWYFTLALMNHNAELCMDVVARNKARDWAEAQLICCADWAVQTPFWSCWRYLWLNYHTVHHVFPKLDFSHHHAAQKILMETCAEHGVRYTATDALTVYKEMIHSFRNARSLFQEILIYGS